VTGPGVAAWVITAVVLTWAVMRVRMAVMRSRFQAELARMHEDMRAEIRHWQDQSDRAKGHAAQVARDSATWAVAWKQGRDDAFSTVRY
jgi:hypothetical protein